MIEEPVSSRKLSAETSHTLQMAAAIGQSYMGSYGAWVCVECSPRAHRKSALTVLFTTIK